MENSANRSRRSLSLVLGVGVLLLGGPGGQGAREGDQ